MLHNRARSHRAHAKYWYSRQTLASLRDHLSGLLMGLAALVCLHVMAMVLLEDMSLWDALWLTLTTLTTVGYGDLAARSFYGQLATVLLLYIPGIALLGQFVGEYVDYRINRRERMVQGLWRWDMKDHILILNSPRNDGDRYLLRLVEQINKTPELRELPIQILTPGYPDGLPAKLRSLGVVHHSGTPTSFACLDEVNTTEARYILVVSHDVASINADSQTIDILEHLSSLQLKAHVVAECVEDENRLRFLRLAANSVIRPIRAYPELLVRALVTPGSEQVMEDLFTHDGVHPVRYDLEVEGLLWGRIVCALIEEGLGTALAYVKHNNQVVTSPVATETVHARSLIIIVNPGSEPGPEQIRDCLGRLPPGQTTSAQA